jgi:hypothetical protein
MHKINRVGKLLVFSFLAATALLSNPKSAFAATYTNPTNLKVYTSPVEGNNCEIVAVWDDVGGVDSYMVYFDELLSYGGGYPAGDPYWINGQAGHERIFGPDYSLPIPSAVTVYSYYNSLWPVNDGNYSTGISASIDPSCPAQFHWVTDSSGNSSIELNDATDTVNYPPVLGTISASSNPIQINTQVNLSAVLSDSNTSDTHTAVWDWGDGTTSSGLVSETNGSGNVTGAHTYLVPGVYSVQLKIVDSGGMSATQTFNYLSVYNPSPTAIFSGARIFDSPAGAVTSNAATTGRVQFGVTSKYDKNGQATGKVSMKFNEANISFESNEINSLVTVNSLATLRGSGTINGAGKYSFLVTGFSGKQEGGTIRFQIKDLAGNVVYDTQPGASDAALPSVVTTGQIVVH